MGKRGPDCAIAFASLPGAAGPGQGGQIEERRDGNPSNGHHEQTASTGGQPPPAGDAGPEQDERRPDPQVACANLGASWRQNGVPPRFTMPSTPPRPLLMASHQSDLGRSLTPGTASSAMSSASRNGPPLSLARLSLEALSVWTVSLSGLDWSTPSALPQTVRLLSRGSPPL